MPGRLAGKIAVVVGGGQMPGSGIGNGRAISVLFAREGAKVMVVARHLERAQETVDMILEEGGEAFAYACDTTDENQVKQMFAACVEKYGCIDIMMNNVGIVPNSDTGLLTTPEDTYEKVMDVNLKAALFCIRNVHPYMQKQGKGAIVQTTSMAGACVTKNGGPITYSLSKCGMIRLGELAAAQFAKDGIRCNNIILGMVQTPIGIEPSVERGIERQSAIEMRNKLVPLKGGMGTAWDTAYAALFLASDEAKYITGVNLPVDGGCCVMRG